MLDTSSEGFPEVASTATEPAMSLTRSSVTSSNSRLAGASMVHSLAGIPPVLPVGPPGTPNDISHLVEVKMYRVSVPEVTTGPGPGRPGGQADRRGRHEDTERAWSGALVATREP